MTSLLLFFIRVGQPSGRTTHDLTLAADPRDGSSVHALQQQPSLQLSINVGKGEFFEDEPIYVAFRLTNASLTDTAWVQPFEVMPDKLNVSLKRSDGLVVPSVTLWIDYVTSPSYRGIPIPPGGDLFRLLVLQDWWGLIPSPTDKIFHHHIDPGAYRLAAQFDPRVSTAKSSLPAIVVAQAVSFTVRPRTATEEAASHEVQDVMTLVWDRARREQFVPALLDLAERRLRADSMDPYVAYLFNDGVVMAEASQLPLDSTQTARVMVGRLATAHAQRTLPAGALIAETAFVAGRGNPQPVLETLGSSLAGDVIRARQARYFNRP